MDHSYPQVDNLEAGSDSSSDSIEIDVEDHRHFINTGAQYTLSNQGTKMVILEQELFKKKRIKSGDIIDYVCIDTKCNARVSVDPKDIIVDVSKLWHRFNPTAKLKIHKKEFHNKLKLASSTMVRVRPQDIYRDVLVETDNNRRTLTSPEKSAVVGTIRNHARTITRVKSSNRAKPPQSVSEIQLTDTVRTFESLRTGPTNFVLANDVGTGDKPRIIILGTIANLEKMAQCARWTADGTFSTSPDLFYQLYTIHGEYYGRTFPWVFCILPDKILIVACFN